jgi:hypothetical protein
MTGHASASLVEAFSEGARTRHYLQLWRAHPISESGIATRCVPELATVDRRHRAFARNPDRQSEPAESIDYRGYYRRRRIWRIHAGFGPFITARSREI